MKMKSIKSFAVAGLLAVVALGTSCNKLKDFGTTNANPAAVTERIPYALLTNIEWQLGGFATNATTSIWVQYFSEAEYTGAGRYAIPQTNFSATYSSVLYDAQTVINISTNPAEVAMARMLKAYMFWTITDRWGDIPYETALKGVVPTYSKQEDIYKDLIKELTEAVAQMPASGSQRGDIIYGANPNTQFANWKKFGNSLRMMMALRLSKRYPGASDYAATQFKAALNDAAGSISNNAENFVVRYVGGGADNAYSNPFYYTNLQARDNGLSIPNYTLLTGVNDPRATVFGSSTTAVPYGYNDLLINTWRQANPGWARIFAPAYRTITSPVYVITAAEVLLTRAEAADRGWTSEDVNTLYVAGITASFAQWGFGAPSASYLANSNVALSAPAGTGANLKNIATQFYFAAFPDGTQAWSNWRRTGYPVLTPGAYPLSPSHTTIPRRFTYGTLEYSANLANVTIANSRLTGGDVQEARVWWDL